MDPSIPTSRPDLLGPSRKELVVQMELTMVPTGTHANQQVILASHVDSHRDEDASTPSKQSKEDGMLGQPVDGESPRDVNDTQPNYSLNGRNQEKQTLGRQWIHGGFEMFNTTVNEYWDIPKIQTRVSNKFPDIMSVAKFATLKSIGKKKLIILGGDVHSNRLMFHYSGT